jgi:hypothetical protein
MAGRTLNPSMPSTIPLMELNEKTTANIKLRSAMQYRFPEEAKHQSLNPVHAKITKLDTTTDEI